MANSKIKFILIITLYMLPALLKAETFYSLLYLQTHRNHLRDYQIYNSSKNIENYPFIKENFKNRILLSIEIYDHEKYAKNDFSNNFITNHKILIDYKNFRLYNELIYDSKLSEKSYFSGYNKNDSYTGYSRLGFIDYYSDYFYIRFGRLPFSLGYSPFSNLLFTETKNGFDRLELLLSVKNYGFQAFFGKLKDSQRNISFHRIFTHFKSLRISLQEATVYGGDTKMSYANPFIFYHGLQMNHEGESNTIGSICASFLFNPHIEVYGEFLFDDFQFENKTKHDLEPAEIGWKIGLIYKNIWKRDLFYYEYTGITNRTYNSLSNKQKFMLGNPNKWLENLGSPYGNDFDIHRLKYTIFFPNSSIYCYFHYLRKGSGDIRKDFDTPWLANNINMKTGYNENFPSGTVNHSCFYEVQGSYNVLKNLALRINLSYNYLIDSKKDNYSIKIDARYILDYLDINIEP